MSPNQVRIAIEPLSDSPFCVRVPVLSLRRYSIRPSSSGKVDVRTIVSGISLSCMIWWAYTVLPMSRLTRRLSEAGQRPHSAARGARRWKPTHEIGMILENKIKNRNT